MHKPRYNVNKEYENLINEIRVEKGLTLQNLASLIKISPSHMWHISQGYHGPLNEKSGHLKEWVPRLEKVLGYDLSEIFPRAVCSIAANNLTDEQIALIAHGYDSNDKIDKRLWIIETFNLVLNVIEKHLSHRERTVIRLRFFKNMTLREIGNMFELSHDRIRQIEAKGLRLIRHYYRKEK